MGTTPLYNLFILITIITTHSYHWPSCHNASRVKVNGYSNTAVTLKKSDTCIINLKIKQDPSNKQYAVKHEMNDNIIVVEKSLHWHLIKLIFSM